MTAFCWWHADIPQDGAHGGGEPPADLAPTTPAGQHLLVARLAVAESSLKKDRELKQRIYARAGVPEYWIVNTQGKCIEAYRSPSPEGYTNRQQIAHAGKLAPLRFPDVEIAVSDVIK